MKTTYGILFVLILLLIQSCSSWQYYTAKRFINNHFCRDIESITPQLYGTYQSEELMVNGEHFFVKLNENKTFIEKNAFGTFYGKWSPSRFSPNRIDIIYVAIDSIASSYNFHYDGDEVYKSMWTSMYYYTPKVDNEAATVTLKDRSGSGVNIATIYAEDSAGNTIDYFSVDAENSKERFVIPIKTRKIALSAGQGNIDGMCYYNSDSGNVVITIIPQCQDHRLQKRGCDMYFYIYDRHGQVGRKSRIKLIRQK